MVFTFKVKHPGRLHKAIGISNGIIPDDLFLGIIATPIGKIFVNRTGKGFSRIDVTDQIWHDAKRGWVMKHWRKCGSKSCKLKKTTKKNNIRK